MPENTKPEPSQREELLTLLPQAAAAAARYIRTEDSLPDSRFREPSAMLAALGLSLGAEGHEPEAVLEKLEAIMAFTPSSSSERFLNQLFGGRIAVAAAAELLAAAANSSMYTLKAAGAQVLVENEVLSKMLVAIGFANGEGSFTPGGSSANMTALLLARNGAEPRFRDEGYGGPALVAYTSAEAHYSIPKNAGMLGLGRRNVRLVPVDASGRMQAKALEESVRADLAAGLRPFFINATAGTTVRGAFDPFRELAAIAKRHGLWLHVDGALGGSVALSAAHRGLLDGAALADSFAWNPHKMMGTQLQTSALLVARKGLLAGSLDETADYLFQADQDDFNPGHRSPLCGRRNDALRLWAAWYRLGDEGWNRRIDRQMALARFAARSIEADAELALVEEPPLINVCFEYPGVSSAALCDYLDTQGIMKIGHGEAKGRRAIRLVCVNPDISEERILALLDDVKKAARALLNQEGKQ
jgi:glutamate/tyrosine decarboxylase-like PLP-dependent enzyme